MTRTTAAELDDGCRLPVGEPMAVDVNILSWERVDDTIAAVESALAQQGIDVAVVVVDQGSSEESLARLRAAFADRPNVLLHALGHNSGCAGGRNIAAALGRSEIMVTLDNDAVFESPNALATVVKRFEAEPELGALGFQILDAATGELDLLSWGYPPAQLAMADQPFLTTRFVGAGHALRRSAFNAAGGFDATFFIYWEEPDLSYRIINCGYKIAYDPSIKVLHKVSPERRSTWSGGRYFLYTRNRLVMEYKYYHNVPGVLKLGAGYVVRGAMNGLTWQAIKGCLHALARCWHLAWGKDKQLVRLSSFASQYIQQHDAAYRGALWDRLRRETLVRLPGH